MSNKIFFSNHLSNINNLSKNFDEYLSSKKNYSIPKLDINIHPRSYDFPLQNQLKNNFEKIIIKNKKKFSKKSKKRFIFSYRSHFDTNLSFISQSKGHSYC